MGLALAAYADDSHTGACRNLEVQTARASLSGIELNTSSRCTGYSITCLDAIYLDIATIHVNADACTLDNIVDARRGISLIVNRCRLIVVKVALTRSYPNTVLALIILAVFLVGNRNRCGISYRTGCQVLINLTVVVGKCEILDAGISTTILELEAQLSVLLVLQIGRVILFLTF